MRVRIRGPTGQATINLPKESATIGDLRTHITEKTSIIDFDIKYGYPPKPLSLQDHDAAVRLSDFSVDLDGEQLIVSPATALPSKYVRKDSLPPSLGGDHVDSNEAISASTENVKSPLTFANNGPVPLSPHRGTQKPISLNRTSTSTDMNGPEIALPTHASILVLRIMPDDNSCLFRAFSTAFFGSGIDSMYELRSIIAQYIQSHQEQYSGVILEREPDDYCKWIQTEDAWGGAIELDILSRHFEVEICSIDVQTLRTDRFNEGRPMRCILVYSGIHYDTIALSPSDAPHAGTFAPPESDTKIFDAGDSLVLEGAIKLCKILQGKHYYTDTASFSITCNVCGKPCVGEKGATEHAKETGHYDFGEAG